jgi:hypothetical protein
MLMASLATRLLTRKSALALLLSLTPCGGDNSADGSADGSKAFTPALDPSAFVANLSVAQKGELCDWIVGRLGGYGTTTSCPGGTGVPLAASQADCVSGFNVSLNSCQATVQDEYNCTNLVVQLPCASTYSAEPQCEPVISCM